MPPSTSTVRQQRKVSQPAVPLSVTRRIMLTIILCIGAVLICIGLFVGWKAGWSFGEINANIAAMRDDKEALSYGTLVALGFAIGWCIGAGLLASAFSVMLLAIALPYRRSTYQLKPNGAIKTIDGPAEFRTLMSFAFFLIAVAALMVVLNLGASMFVTI